MKVKYFNEGGSRAGEFTLPLEVFGLEPSNDLIYRAVEAEKNNRRQGSHHTKTRSEVSGGGKKPWKQKGTGNARQGSIRVPHWRGGGVALGPRSFHPYSLLPKKMRKQGVLSVLSSKAKEGVVSVIRSLEFQEYSTKKLANVLKLMGISESSSIVILFDKESLFLSKSASNLPNVILVQSKRIILPEVFYASKLVIVESAIDVLRQQYASPSDNKEHGAISKKAI